MKISKIMTAGLLFVSCLGISSCGGLNTQTKYHVPKVANDYKKISKEEFETAFNEKRNFNEYDYFSVDVTYKNPIELYGGAIIVNNEHFVGRINKAFGEEEWYPWCYVYISAIHTSPQFDPAAMYIFYVSLAYGFENAVEYTSAPYSYEKTSEAGDIPSQKVTFDDNFLVSSISLKDETNEVEMKFKYFNKEDLPNNTGEISRETYQEIAFVNQHLGLGDYSEVEVIFDCKNVVIKQDKVIENGRPKYIPTYGDAKYKVTYDIIDVEGIMFSNPPGYYLNEKNFELLSGEKVVDEEMFIIRLNSLLSEAMFGNNYIFPYGINPLKERKVVYTNNPLTVIVNEEEKKEIVKFDKDGHVVEYFIEKGETTVSAKIVYK